MFTFVDEVCCWGRRSKFIRRWSLDYSTAWSVYCAWWIVMEQVGLSCLIDVSRFCKRSKVLDLVLWFWKEDDRHFTSAALFFFLSWDGAIWLCLRRAKKKKIWMQISPAMHDVDSVCPILCVSSSFSQHCCHYWVSGNEPRLVSKRCSEEVAQLRRRRAFGWWCAWCVAGDVWCDDGGSDYIRVCPGKIKKKAAGNKLWIGHGAE